MYRLKKNSFFSIFADEVSYLKLTYYKCHNILKTLHTSCKLTHYLGAWTSNLAGLDFIKVFPESGNALIKVKTKSDSRKTAREYPNSPLDCSSRDDTSG